MKNIFILLILLLYSCQDNQPRVLPSGQENEIEHFPNDASERVNDVLIVDSSAFYNTTKMILHRKLSLNELNAISSKKYYLTCKATDSCIVVINDFLNKENRHIKLSKQKSSVIGKCKKIIPIPNFYDLEKINNKTKSHLNPNCEILITTLKKGLLSTKIDPRKSSMPKEYFHGSVSGIVLNREDTTAIYFVQFW